MNAFTATFGADKRVVLPVIHVESEAQAARNAMMAWETGCNGVFLINHGIAVGELLRVHEGLVREMPGWWVGVNCLGVHPQRVFDLVPPDVSGVWVDNACIDERTAAQDAAESIRSTGRRSSWKGLYFGGVAFKYQRPVKDVRRAATIASRYMDVVTTSGSGTGTAAAVEKIAAMKEALGAFPLAIASGITPENVESYLGIADCFLVATGISRSWAEFDRAKLASLMAVVRAGADESSAATAHRGCG